MDRKEDVLLQCGYVLCLLGPVEVPVKLDIGVRGLTCESGYGGPPGSQGGETGAPDLPPAEL